MDADIICLDVSDEKDNLEESVIEIVQPSSDQHRKEELKLLRNQRALEKARKASYIEETKLAKNRALSSRQLNPQIISRDPSNNTILSEGLVPSRSTMSPQSSPVVDVIQLSGDSSSEEEEEKGAPSILTEIEAGSRQILERAAAADRSLSSGAKKRPGETPTESNKKRRSISPCDAPSVIIEGLKSAAPEVRAVAQILPRRHQGPPRTLQTSQQTKAILESDSTNGSESTSEKYLKQIAMTANTDKDIIIDDITIEKYHRKSPAEKIEKANSTKNVNKSKASKSPDRPKSQVEIEMALDVKGVVVQFLKSCKGVLPQQEYQSVEKKIQKYLNNIPEVLHKSVRLKNFIEMKWGLLDSDHKNVYIQIRGVLDEMKKYKREGKSDTTSEPSDSNSERKKVKLTTIYQPLRKEPPSIKDKSDIRDSSRNSVKHSDEDDIEIITESKPNKSSEVLNDSYIGETSTNFTKNSNSLKTTLKPSTEFSSVSTHQKEILSVNVFEASTGRNVIERDTINDNPVAGGRFVESANAGTATSEGKEKTASKRHIRKLEKALAQCQNKIRKLEETEIDFNQEEDDESGYVLEARYKKRFMEIYRKLAKYKQLSTDLNRRTDKRFKFEESEHQEINVKISKFVNRTKEFPDFLDIKKLVSDVNMKNKLGLVEAQVHLEAERLFQAVGKRLKLRRGNDDFESISSHFKEDNPVDPASQDEALAQRLLEQDGQARKKMDSVFQAFVEKQVKREKPGGARDDNTEDTDYEDDEGEEEEGDEEQEGKEDWVDASDDGYDEDKGEEKVGVAAGKDKKGEEGRTETEKDNQGLSLIIDKPKSCSETSTLSTKNKSVVESAHKLSSKQPFAKTCDILSPRLSEGLSGEIVELLEVDSEDVVSLGSRDADGEEDNEIE